MRAWSKDCGRRGYPAECIQLVPTTDRAAVGYMLAKKAMTDYIDVIVAPRGQLKPGRARAEGSSRTGHWTSRGKLSRLCGSRRGCTHGPHHRGEREDAAYRCLWGRRDCCSLTALDPLSRTSRRLWRICSLPDVRFAAMSTVQKVDPRVCPASEDDWHTEYLDSIIAARVVDGVDGRPSPTLRKYGSAHTRSPSSRRMTQRPSASSNTSTAPSCFTTRRHSSPTAASSGMGAEIGISTDRFPCARAGGRGAADEL